jgi:hypothetical protein
MPTSFAFQELLSADGGSPRAIHARERRRAFSLRANQGTQVFWCRLTS